MRARLIFGLLSVFGAGVLAAADLEAERRAVREADLALSAAVGERQPERFKALIAEDGVFLGGSALRGPEEVAAGWAVFFDPESRTTLEWRPTDAVVASSGELAYTLGEAEMRAPDPRTGEVTARPIRYLTAWRKVGGAWKVLADGTHRVDPEGRRVAARTRRAALLDMDPALAGLAAQAEFKDRPERFYEAADLSVAVGEYVVTGDESRGTGWYLSVSRKDAEDTWRVVAESLSPPAVE